MNCMSEMLDELRRAIEDSPESRYRLSKKTGIEQSQLSRFMAGSVRLGVESVERLAQALGYEIVMRKKRKRKKV